ncbi:MAG: amidohydrolase family protein [Chloroflexi bacterium]|jgi:predicted TIM-barrel fold metal-dependent hydrolase|nr:amidohydrolase family protein [Anaerolineaceae bacterium]NMB91136.1 amidohydrolase family protein [Chloroflexota bacterium]
MTKIIDVHVHIGNDHYNTYTAEESIALMDKNGIDLAVISPVSAYPLPYGVKSSMEQNDLIAGALQQYPQRFVRGLGVVDPRHGKAAVPEVDRIFGELGLHGLMFSNDRTGITFDNPTMLEFMEHASGYDHPVVLAYTSQYSVLEAPYMLQKVAEQFPNITFINGSAMKDTTHSNNSRYLSAKLENVYMDVANIHQLMHPVEWAIRDSGADKILFGTNIPFCEYSTEKRMIDVADITAEDREKIYWGNAARIFRL